jgi:formate dehydrogenase assembly factor FdhD
MQLDEESDQAGDLVAPDPSAERLTRAVEGRDHDWRTSCEETLEKKTRTSGGAPGTVFGDTMAGLEGVTLAALAVRTSQHYAPAHRLNRTPSPYPEAGTIHGMVPCQGARALVYMEDVGRPDAVDGIAGWIPGEGFAGGDRLLYATRAVHLGDGNQDGDEGNCGARLALGPCCRVGWRSRRLWG